MTQPPLSLPTHNGCQSPLELHVSKLGTKQVSPLCSLRTCWLLNLNYPAPSLPANSQWLPIPPRAPCIEIGDQTGQPTLLSLSKFTRPSTPTGAPCIEIGDQTGQPLCSPCPSSPDRQPLLELPLAKLETKQVSPLCSPLPVHQTTNSSWCCSQWWNWGPNRSAPIPSPPPSSQWLPTPPCAP
jgi:hypothetical protein